MKAGRPEVIAACGRRRGPRLGRRGLQPGIAPASRLIRPGSQVAQHVLDMAKVSSYHVRM